MIPKKIRFANPKDIIQIKIVGKRPTAWKFFHVVIEKRFIFWQNVISSGWSTDYYSERVSFDSVMNTKNYLGEHIYVSNKECTEVYLRPYVHVKFRSYTNNDGADDFTKLFDTIEQALEWTKQFIKQHELSDKLVEI